jgi:hypothetical protein
VISSTSDHEASATEVPVFVILRIMFRSIAIVSDQNCGQFFVFCAMEGWSSTAVLPVCK